MALVRVCFRSRTARFLHFLCRAVVFDSMVDVVYHRSHRACLRYQSIRTRPDDCRLLSERFSGSKIPLVSGDVQGGRG